MPCKTKASPEEMLDQIASYLYQGVTITQAAENLHMSRITFRKWVLRYKEEGFKGLRPRQHLSYYSNQMKIQAVKEYLKGGVSMLSVCAKYRISGTLSLKTWIEAYNEHKLTDLVSEGGDLMGKRQQSVKEERVRIVQECIASGCDYNKIAKKYNMSYQTLYTWVKKFKEMGEVGLEDYRGKPIRLQTPRTEEERLRQENARLLEEKKDLIAEIALLKKKMEIEEHSADKPTSAFSFDWILFLGLLAGIALCTLIISYLSKRPKEQTMHYALNTFNLALVIVVTALSIQPKPNQLNKMEEPSMKQDNKLSVLDNIHARTSIRSYQPKEVEDEKIEQLLRAAMAAPTATNRQPWAFIVIRDKETMNELGSTLPYAKMVKDAPLAIAVCGDLTKAISGAGIEYWVQDASAASENLLLAAQALGLGAVWTGVYPIDERVKEVQKILQLPEQIVPLNVIPIGYPAENPLPKDKWKPENVHYDRWTEPDKK